jgi:hypothetical protein
MKLRQGTMKLKVLTITAICLSIGTIAYGQKSSDKVSSGICKCIDDKIPSIADNLHLQDSVDACFAQGMATDFEGLRKEYKMKGDGITVEQIREIRDRLWGKLEKGCEKFKRVVAEL